MLKILSTASEIKKFLGTEPLQSASIRVTMACNLKCKQCYAVAGKKMENELSLVEIKKVLDDLKDLGVIRIFFTGGEPFIRPDMLEILDHADKNNFAMYISTNGVFIDKEKIDFLKTLKHLRTFQVSLDGLNNTHDSIRGVKGTFNKAICTIKLAQKELKNTQVTLISTLLKENLHEIEKIVKLSIELKVGAFGLVTLYPVKRSPEAEDITALQKHNIFKKIAEIHKNDRNKNLKIGLLVPPALVPKPLKELEYGCGYVCSFPSLLGINANGNVAPCDGLLNYKEFILGNVRNDSLKKIWNHPLMKKLKQIKPKDIGGACHKCRHLSFCMGGCRARAFLEYGNFTAPNPLCQSFYEKGLLKIED